MYTLDAEKKLITGFTSKYIKKGILGQMNEWKYL